MVEKGSVAIRMVKLRETSECMKPVYGALRNHFRLILAYENELNGFGLEAGVRIKELYPTTGIPETPENKIELEWQKLHGFGTESALCYQLLQTFMKEALKRSLSSNPDASKNLSRLGLEDIDLSSFDRIEGDHEILTQQEKTFRAIINYGSELPENLNHGFLYLKAEIQTAHIAGDGVYVLHLLEIASTKLPEWVQDKRNTITPKDIEWFFAMKLFWGMGTIDIDSELYEFERLQNETFSAINPTSKILINLIHKHFTTYLGNVDITQVKDIISREWIIADAANDFPVRPILLGLLIEHAWLRNNENNHWLALLEHIILLLESESPVIRKPFAELKNRLLHQKDLIIFQPNPKQEPIDSEDVRQIANAYRFYLDSNRNDLLNSLRVAKSKVDLQNPYYSVWHSLNRLVSFYIESDSYRTQISQWFMYASNSPLERYLTLLSERLAEKKEKEIDDNFSDRYPTIPAIAKLLITLQQIEMCTLRKWSLIRYRFVLRERAKCLMAIAHSEEVPEQRAMYAFHAIRTFALSMDIPESDKRFKTLFNYLAFGPHENYESLIGLVLQSPKNEWTRLASIFAFLGDAIPESLVEKVIQWYIRLEHVPVEERYGNATYLKKW